MDAVYCDDVIIQDVTPMFMTPMFTDAKCWITRPTAQFLFSL